MQNTGNRILGPRGVEVSWQRRLAVIAAVATAAIFGSSSCSSEFDIFEVPKTSDSSTSAPVAEVQVAPTPEAVIMPGAYAALRDALANSQYDKVMQAYAERNQIELLTLPGPDDGYVISFSHTRSDGDLYAGVRFDKNGNLVGINGAMYVIDGAPRSWSLEHAYRYDEPCLAVNHLETPSGSAGVWPSYAANVAEDDRVWDAARGPDAANHQSELDVGKFLEVLEFAETTYLAH